MERDIPLSIDKTAMPAAVDDLVVPADQHIGEARARDRAIQHVHQQRRVQERHGLLDDGSLLHQVEVGRLGQHHEHFQRQIGLHVGETAEVVALIEVADHGRRD